MGSSESRTGVFTSTQPLTARSRQNTKEVEDCMSSSNLLRVLGKCLGSVQNMWYALFEMKFLLFFKEMRPCYVLSFLTTGGQKGGTGEDVPC